MQALKGGMKRKKFIVIIFQLIAIIGIAQPTISITSSANETVCVNETVTFIVDTSGCNSSSQQIEWFVNDSLVFVSDTNVFSANTFANGDQISAQYSCLDGNGNTIDSVISATVALSIDDPMAEAGDNYVIDLGDEVILNGSGNGSYLWGPSEGLSSTTVAEPTASPEATTTYYLTVTSDNGCESEDYVTVSVIILRPTNTFTPNGDGYNDTWDIGGISFYPNAKINVYDRWGQKVFNVIGYTSEKKWDGTNRGLKLPAGTYYYVIDKNNGSDEKFVVGYVTIIK